MTATTYTNSQTDQNLTSSTGLTFESASSCDGAVRVKTLKSWETEEHPFINGQVMGVVTYWRAKARIL